MKKGPKNGKDDTDDTLWQMVARGVKAYAPQQPKAPVSEPRQDTPKNLPQPPARSEHTGMTEKARLDRGIAEKLKKGRLAIEGRIDLHGMTQTEAYAALCSFMARAAQQEWRTLLIITGKGRVTEGGGVLRRMLPLWLEEFPAVLAVTPAQPKDGGAGAFYIRLRKKKDRL